MKVKSLTDKINELLKPRLSSDEDSDEEVNDSTAPRIVDFEQDEYDLPDARSTEFRKRNVKLLSEQSSRYKGKITSRKELQGDDNSHEDDSDADGDELKDSSEELSMEEGDKETNADEESDDADFDDDSDDDEMDETDPATDVISESNRQAEIQKGVCVQNQLLIWERLLELRIQTQKILTKANQLPTPEDDNRSNYLTDGAKDTSEKTCLLLKLLLDLKTVLTSQFSELRNDLKVSLKDNSVLSDYVNGEPPLKRIAVHLEDQHNQMRAYRNKVLLKWDDRTKLLKPGGGKRKSNEEFDILRKIDNALLNKDALISKSRLLQNVSSASEQNEKDNTTEQQAAISNKNVYDDSDFYHQQLRELIEYKASSSSNIAEVTKQMVELHKIRQKMKKKVDTRASKGRKIRYVVHNKLINFMAPDDSDSANWTNESKDELYKSLFAT